MWRGIYEVRQRNESGGKPNDGAVEGCNKDLWVGVEGVCYLCVVGNEGFEYLTPDVGTFGMRPGDCDIGTAK